MWFLTIFTYLAIIVQIVFITVAIAAALYYLAELVEEYTVLTKKCIWWLNTATLGFYVCLWLFENFPNMLVLCGISAQIVHYVILRNFPCVYFLSPAFLLGVGFIMINHYLAFQYFAAHYYMFSEVIGYFTLCLWLVPFALFISLSANDNILPTVTERAEGDVVSNYFSKKGKKYGLLTFFNYAKESVLPQRVKKGF